MFGPSGGVHYSAPPTTPKDTNLHAILATAAFDPADPGTEESYWEMVLRDAKELILPEAELLVVSPHPDDETLGAGGLICTAATRGHAVSVLSVTDGEAAYPNWKGLQKVRRREVGRALSLLSPYPLKIKRLNIPDGQVADYRELLTEAIDRMASSTTLLVAPYELDGHPDHEVTGVVCLEVAQRRKLKIWRYPVWMWHHGASQAVHRLSWGRHWLDGETQRLKRLAIDCFASQLRPTARAPILPAHVLPYFARAYEAFLI